MPTDQAETPPHTPPLELEAQEVLPRVRSAVARVLGSVPDAGRRPAAVSRALGLHQTLAWKLVQIVENPDPFATVQHIPGEGGIEIFLKAAASKGVPAAQVEAVRAAVADFRRLIESHAGDRASLELMLAGLAQRPVSPVELSIRKAGFRCASYTWGVQCRAGIKTLFLKQGADPDTFDIAAVRGYIGLRRVRPNTAWPLSRRRYFNETGQVQRSTVRPIDPGSGTDTIPLLTPFCSRPLPDIETVISDNGMKEYRLRPGPVGDRSAINCFIGDIMPGRGERWGSEVDRTFDHGLQNRTPAEAITVDAFVHRDLWNDIDPESLVISELSDEPWYAPNKAPGDRLPFPEQVRRLGRGVEASPCPEYPQYPDLIEYVFDRLGWRAEEFTLFRLRVEYPVVRTAVVMRFNRPDRPA